jgi:hypothetical protein
MTGPEADCTRQGSAGRSPIVLEEGARGGHVWTGGRVGVATPSASGWANRDPIGHVKGLQCDATDLGEHRPFQQRRREPDVGQWVDGVESTQRRAEGVQRCGKGGLAEMFGGAGSWFVLRQRAARFGGS